MVVRYKECFSSKKSPPPITVAARSKAWTVFARSNARIMASYPTQGMDDSMFVLSCVSIGLASGWCPVRGVLPTVYRWRNWKICQGPTKGCRAIIIRNDSRILTSDASTLINSSSNYININYTSLNMSKIQWNNFQHIINIPDCAVWGRNTLLTNKWM
jgi:hypothetical protein